MIISDYFVNNGFDVLSESKSAVLVSFKERIERVIIIKNEPDTLDLGLIIYRTLPIKEQVDFICELIYIYWCEDYLTSLLNDKFYYKAYIFCENLKPMFYNGNRREDLYARFDCITESFTLTMLSKIQNNFITFYFVYRKIIQELDGKDFCLNGMLKYNIGIEFRDLVKKYSKSFPCGMSNQIIKNYNKFIHNHYRKEERRCLIVNYRKEVAYWPSEN